MACWHYVYRKKSSDGPAALAKRSGRSKSFYAREAILEHLDDLEAAYLSDEILKRVESGQERTYTLDGLERELVLAD
ncbi:MAG: TraY domain-containing protein [Desulfobulbaceae bacterium]|nr:TraY domain-containing protein [Desulfobulbaceae bacterium]